MKLRPYLKFALIDEKGIHWRLNSIQDWRAQMQRAITNPYTRVANVRTMAKSIQRCVEEAKIKRKSMRSNLRMWLKFACQA